MELSEIQRQALQRSLTLINALGCKFAVLEPDGTKHGDLDVVVPSQRTRTVYQWQLTDIDSRIDGLGVGQDATFKLDEAKAAGCMSLEALEKHVHYRAQLKFGKDEIGRHNFLIVRKADTSEVSIIRA